MLENDDADTGGDVLSVEQAATAYAKTLTDGADNGQPEAEEVEQEADADELQASDEDVSESEGEPDEEGQAEEEVEEEPDSDQGRFVAANGKVRLPDGTVSTVSDLIQGNLRDRDYRQKTMDLAEQRRAHEEKSSAMTALEKQVNDQREYMSQLLQSIMPPPPEPSLLETDPVAYMQAKDQHERFAQHAQYVQHQLEDARQQAGKKSQQDRAEKAKVEWDALQKADSGLKDEAKFKAFVSTIKTAGTDYGFSEQELADTLPFDHRMALVLRDAAKWRNLQASKPKVQQKVQGRPPVQKGGKRLSPDAIRAKNAAEAVTRLKETGSVADAAAAYLASRKG